MVPELDGKAVRKWAHDKTPVDFRDEMRVEVETPRGLTILECRPPWSDLIGSEWTRAPHSESALVPTMVSVDLRLNLVAGNLQSVVLP